MIIMEFKRWARLSISIATQAQEVDEEKDTSE
jgi:hypothetical protein